ncbi:MAG TPA: GvpL/GvpF family gas vesicle protein [Longimicrobiales bacterium]|nr:GvpL/GvpF family gas vesicle protein [Longimicrobiales bacterium]
MGSTGFYLYCIGGADHPAPGDVTGIGGAPVQALALDGLVGWVSPMEAAPGASLQRVREHNDVVERACAERTALPLRFGQWFPGERALGAEIHDRRAALEDGLRRVDGAMEMGVRILDPEQRDDPPDRSTGRAYLETLARRDARMAAAAGRGRTVAAELREWLGPLVRDERVRPLGTSAGLAAAAHLVDRHDIGTYTSRVRSFAARRGELRFLFSGPWPPYGFADDQRQESA